MTTIGSGSGGLVPYDPFEPVAADCPPAEATSEMERALASAARDGRVGGGELKRAEARIAETYGPDVARRVLLESFGVHAGKLTYDAVEILQGRMGSQEGHIGRFQDILDESLKGARILDVNRDGALDADDLVFSKTARGKVNVERIGEARRDELKIAGAMIGGAEAMIAAEHDFAVFADHRANPAFWSVDSEGIFTRNEAVTPSDALQDIFDHPDQYAFECATAMVIVYYKAMHDLIGPEDFDRVAADMKLGGWEQERDLRSVRRSEGDHMEPGSTKSVRPGDYYYFRNWDVSEEGRAAGWKGENVFYLGNGDYYGHPFGRVRAEEIVAHLNEYRSEGSTRSAGITQIHGMIDPRILDLDVE